jgi:DNA invertase Pin-like site-specific DNA recombinase
MMRQIAGAFAEYEKARLVSKLRHARERVRQEKGKCEGRKPHSKLRPDAVALAKRLHRASPKTGKRMSLRKIAAALSEAGHLTSMGSNSIPKALSRWSKGLLSRAIDARSRRDDEPMNEL